MMRKAMDTDVRAFLDMAQSCFDAAYGIDADKFEAIFHPSAAVTKFGDDGTCV